MKKRRLTRKEKSENQRLLQQRQQRMKRQPTKAEQCLMNELLSRYVPFKFQKGFWSERRFYIVDFFFTCKRNVRLVVEVDGSSHKGREEYDERRTDYLAGAKNCRVIRFTNEEVFSDVALVVDKIILYQPCHQHGAIYLNGKRTDAINRKRNEQIST